MTEEQLAVAKQALEGQMERFGFSESNVEFHHGRMEDLKSLGIEDGSIDVVVSNCVINLSDDKAKVFSEIYRVLKPGGELFFSDVFSDRRLSEAAQQDKVAVGECLGGALYQEDFRRLMENVGFLDPRVLIQSPIDVKDDSIVKLVGQTRFTSMTVRSFKLPQSMEDRCEDYGQVATYLGGIEDAEFVFSLDDHHHFEKNRPMLVCGNTAAMVQETRFSSYFRVNGDRKEHFGLFDCAPSSAQTSAQGEGAPSGACC
jgi:SAM-dependent methyltransferase